MSFQFLWSVPALALSLGMWITQVSPVKAVSAADVVDDAYISSVTINSVSSSALGATTSYSLTFVNTSTLAADSTFWIESQTATGCNASDWTTCYAQLNNASVSGLTGTRVDSSNPSVFQFQLSEAVAAGSHTITLGSVVNPSSAVALRLSVSTSASDEQTLLGDDYSNESWYATQSDAEFFGTVLITGTVTTPDAEVMPNTSINFHDETWSVYGYSTTDSQGLYAIFSDYFTQGYWSAGTYTVSAYPNDSDSGFLSTDRQVTYDGASPMSADITLDPSAYFFAGEVIYGSNDTTTSSSSPGDPVTNASLYFYPSTGGIGYSAVTDGQGEYTVAVRPGTYYLSMSLNPSAENQDQDWLFEQTDLVFSISEAGTQTNNISVTITTAKLRGSVTDVNGDVPAQGTVTLSNESQSYSDYTDADGSYTLNLNPGTYTVTFYPDTWSNPDAARYFYPSSTLTVAEGTANLDLVLEEKSSSIEVTVTDESGVPLPDISVGASHNNEWVGGTTDENGQATLWVQSGVTYQVYPYADGYIYNEPSTEVKVGADESESVTFVMHSPDATVNVLVVDADGNVPDDMYGYVNCSDEDYTEWFGGSVSHGSGTVYFVVGEGETFEGSCNLWMNDETLGAAEAVDVSVAFGDADSIQFNLVERSATVTVYVKDTDGKVVKDAHGWVNVWNDESKLWQGKEIDSSGKTEIRVVPGTYVGGVWFEDQSYIPLWHKNNGTVKVGEDETGKLVLTVARASAEVTGTALDPNGDPVEYGWAYCGNWEEVTVQGDFEEGTVIDSGAEIRDGEFSIALVDGHEYRCNVGVPSEYIEQGWLSPEDQVLDIPDGESSATSLSFQFKEADSKIKGSLTWPSESSATAKTNKRAWCWAWGEDGGHSFSDSKSDGTFTLAVQSGGTWHYGCDSQDGSTWLTTGDRSVTLDEAGTVEVSLTLSSFDAWVVYEPVSETFDATENNIINLADGTVLTIPANSIASSGEVTVTATPEVNIVRTGDSMLGIPWNFEAFAEGELVETFNSDVTIEIPYTNSTLDEFGVDEDSLMSKYYDEESGAWKTTENVTQNVKTNTITVTTNHFTQYGVTYSGNLSSNFKPAKPSNLSTYDRTDKTAHLSWKKGSEKQVTKYKIQVRVKGDSKKKNWDSFTTKKRNKLIKKLDKGETYQFRVKACNSGFCSKFSDWKSFKTKN